MTATTTAPGLPKAHQTADIKRAPTSVLYVGPPKSGKTTCALSWPRPLVIDFGSNLSGLSGSVENIPYLLSKYLGSTSEAVINTLTMRLLPALQAGRIHEIAEPEQPVETIVFEDLTYLLGEHLDRMVRGAKEALSGFDDYGTFLHRAENIIVQMTDLTRAGFHVVATIHLGEEGGKDIMERDNRGRWQKVGSTPTKRRPIVPGKFREIISGKFENVLLTQRHMSKRVQPNAQGVAEAVDVAEYYVYTINPDSTYEGIGEGFGRPGGRYKPLPSKLDGRYPSLARAWGILE